MALSTVRTLAERVLPCDDHFVQTDSDVSGTQVQTTAACSSWTTIKEVADKTISQHRVAGVSCQLRSCARAESEGRRFGNPQATRVFGQRMKVHGEWTEHEEVVVPSERGGRRRRTGRTFSSFGQRERSWEDMTRQLSICRRGQERAKEEAGPARPPRAGSS